LNYQTFEIASAQNKMFKKFKSLTLKKYREREHLFLMEGQRYVQTAIENGFEFEAFIFDTMTWSKEEMLFLQTNVFENAQIYILSESLFKELTQTEQSQGIIGVLPLKDPKDISKLIELKSTCKINNILMLDRIQDPGNLGTIIRTADAAGVDGIILIKGTVDPYNAKVIRSSAGSILNVDLVEVDNAVDAINLLKLAGYHIVVTALEGAVDYDDKANYRDKNCLVIGNEANGVSDELIEGSDIRVKIPIVGRAESLNASVAAGIMMYKLQSRK